MLEAETKGGKKKGASRGPAHAWERWNDVDVPERLIILKAFSEAYERFQTAAFGGPKQADASLWKVLANFQGERDWTGADFNEIFASLRLHLTPILEQQPYLAAIQEKLASSPSAVSAAQAWKSLFKGYGVAYNRLSSNANAGFDEFHAWLIKRKPELRKSVRSLLPVPFGGVPSAVGLFKAGAMASALKALVAAGLVGLVVIFAVKLLHHDGGDSRAGQPASTADLSSVTTGESDVSSTGVAKRIARDCAALPPGPDRKSCLIRAADATRSDLTQAERLYRMAIDDNYDPTSAPSSKFPHGYFRWQETAKGPALLLAQNFEARAGLASVLALHGEYARALQEWRNAIATINNPISVNVWGSYFLDPGYTDGEAYIEYFLESKAGITMTNPYRGAYPRYGYQFVRGLRAEHHLASGNWFEALTDATAAFESVYMHPLTKLTVPSNSQYWQGILPSQPVFERTVQTIIVEALGRLKRDGLAVESDNIAFVLDRDHRQILGIQTRRVVDDPCVPDSEREWNESAPARWGFMSLRASQVQVRDPGQPPDSLRISLPKTSTDIEATIAMLRWHGRQWKVICGERTVRARLCVTTDGPWLQEAEMPCRRN
jgi:tetratricopeptide (TPR) repeat protein